MTKLFCLDRYNNKNVALTTTRPATDFAMGDWLVYELPGENGKQSLAKYFGYAAPDTFERTGELLDQLTQEDKKYFDEMQRKALDKFPLFKERFTAEFKTATPVTARYHIFAEQYYFFFYGEERYNFSDFVKRFREELGHNFFLFQVGARDMIKLSPATDCIIGCDGRQLCCKSSRPLPSIEVEALLEQHLDGRDIERIKGRCGKLKCCLVYEADLYFTENKKYPSKGTSVTTCDGACGSVLSFNIMTGKIQIKTNENNYMTIDLSEIKKKQEAGKGQGDSKGVGRDNGAPRQITPREGSKTGEIQRKQDAPPKIEPPQKDLSMKPTIPSQPASLQMTNETK